MTAPGENGRPPAWAEVILRALLAPRNRDTISGDLLEEYCKVVLPQRGELGAKIWYIRQVVSFITIAGLTHAMVARLQEGSMFDTFAHKSWLWLMAGSLAFLIVLGSLFQSDFRPPAGLGVFIVISIAVTVASLISMRSPGDTQVLWRIGLGAGFLVTIVLMTRLLFDVFHPVDPVDRFLAQARDDYSEFNYPRRWLPDDDSDGRRTAGRVAHRSRRDGDAGSHHCERERVSPVRRSGRDRESAADGCV